MRLRIGFDHWLGTSIKHLGSAILRFGTTATGIAWSRLLHGARWSGNWALALQGALSNPAIESETSSSAVFGWIKELRRIFTRHN